MMNAPSWVGNLSASVRRRLPGSVRLESRAAAGLGLTGICPVCGKSGATFEKFTTNMRESGPCADCGATNRQRQMGFMLRRVLRLPPGGAIIAPAGCAIYNTEANGPLHARLAGQIAYVGSEYWGDGVAPGSVVNGVRHEDLQRLSFADSSLEIVLSSDVLEHVPNPYLAHREIHRVPRSGGKHVFTVPFREARSDDLRAVLRQGKPVMLARPLYHGDPVRPDEGVLVWRIFGYEMLRRLREIGFSVSLHRLFAPACGIMGPGAIVFVACKRRPQSAP